MTRAFTLLALVFLVSACDSASEPDIASVAGTWSGVAILPNGFSASADLTQNGRAVGGTMRISGSFINAPVVAEIDDLGRLAWEVQSGCDRWSGVLTIAPDAQRMEGTLNLDGSLCSPTTAASGTLRLCRESPCN